MSRSWEQIETANTGPSPLERGVIGIVAGMRSLYDAYQDYQEGKSARVVVDEAAHYAVQEVRERAYAEPQLAQTKDKIQEGKEYIAQLRHQIQQLTGNPPRTVDTSPDDKASIGAAIHAYKTERDIALNEVNGHLDETLSALQRQLMPSADKLIQDISGFLQLGKKVFGIFKSSGEALKLMAAGLLEDSSLENIKQKQEKILRQFNLKFVEIFNRLQKEGRIDQILQLTADKQIVPPLFWEAHANDYMDLVFASGRHVAELDFSEWPLQDSGLLKLAQYLSDHAEITVVRITLSEKCNDANINAFLDLLEKNVHVTDLECRYGERSLENAKPAQFDKLKKILERNKNLDAVKATYSQIVDRVNQTIVFIQADFGGDSFEKILAARRALEDLKKQVQGFKAHYFYPLENDHLIEKIEDQEVLLLEHLTDVVSLSLPSTEGNRMIELCDNVARTIAMVENSPLLMEQRKEQIITRFLDRVLTLLKENAHTFTPKEVESAMSVAAPRSVLPGGLFLTILASINKKNERRKALSEKYQETTQHVLVNASLGENKAKDYQKRVSMIQGPKGNGWHLFCVHGIDAMGLQRRTLDAFVSKAAQQIAPGDDMPIEVIFENIAIANYLCGVVLSVDETSKGKAPQTDPRLKAACYEVFAKLLLAKATKEDDMMNAKKDAVQDVFEFLRSALKEEQTNDEILVPCATALILYARMYAETNLDMEFARVHPDAAACLSGNERKGISGLARDLKIQFPLEAINKFFKLLRKGSLLPTNSALKGDDIFKFQAVVRLLEDVYEKLVFFEGTREPYRTTIRNALEKAVKRAAAIEIRSQAERVIDASAPPDEEEWEKVEADEKASVKADEASVKADEASVRAGEAAGSGELRGAADAASSAPPVLSTELPPAYTPRAVAADQVPSEEAPPPYASHAQPAPPSAQPAPPSAQPAPPSAPLAAPEDYAGTGIAPPSGVAPQTMQRDVDVRTHVASLPKAPQSKSVMFPAPPSSLPSRGEGSAPAKPKEADTSPVRTLDRTHG